MEEVACVFESDVLSIWQLQNLKLLNGVDGGGKVVPANPLTAISVIDAQLFCVFPLTVILTNLPTVFAGKLYLSDDKVAPVLFPVNGTLVKYFHHLKQIQQSYSVADFHYTKQYLHCKWSSVRLPNLLESMSLHPNLTSVY